MNQNLLWTFMATLLLTACGSEYETSSTDNPENISRYAIPKL